MAGAAGGDEATVSKEMAGNSFAVSSGRCHRASTAQRGRESRRVSCVRPGILDGERGAGLVRRLVVREHWSPGRIAGGIAVERPGLMVFASAIHRAINECLCSISCCGFSHDDFSGLGRACRPRNGLNWMVLVSPPERTGKDYDQHAPSTVYPSFAAERGIRRVDRAENTCQRADGA